MQHIPNHDSVGLCASDPVVLEATALTMELWNLLLLLLLLLLLEVSILSGPFSTVYVGNTIGPVRRQALPVTLAYATTREQQLAPKAILIQFVVL